MKKLLALLGLASLVIAACMVYLLREGISLRAAPLISPSPVGDGGPHVAGAVISRLFPDLQEIHDLVLGLWPETDESRAFLQRLSDAYAKDFGHPPQILWDAENTADDVRAACAKSCWHVVDRERANELAPNAYIDGRLKPLKRPFMTLTVWDFTAIPDVPAGCLEEKRLTLDCLIPLSIQGARRKMKDPAQRYFFMKKYNDRDVFLFIQR